MKIILTTSMTPQKSESPALISIIIILQNICHIVTWTLAVDCSILLSEQSPLLVFHCICVCNETVCFLLCRGGGRWTNILWCLDAEPILTWVFCNILQVKLGTVATARTGDMVYCPGEWASVCQTPTNHTQKTNSCATFQWKTSVVTSFLMCLPQFICKPLTLATTSTPCFNEVMPKLKTILKWILKCANRHKGDWGNRVSIQENLGKKNKQTEDSLKYITYLLPKKMKFLLKP